MSDLRPPAAALRAGLEEELDDPRAPAAVWMELSRERFDPRVMDWLERVKTARDQARKQKAAR